MEKFNLFANPWWVNLFFLAPFVVYFFWKGKLEIPRHILFYTGVFGAAFGFMEAAVVVYLRSATGFLSMENGLLLNAVNFHKIYQGADGLERFPTSLLTIEIYRETATIIMLLAVATLAITGLRNRLALFFWTFAFWDIFYYVGLWLTIKWPSALTDMDILFLIPAPWFGQVWFPLLISIMLILAVIFGLKKYRPL